MTHEGKAWQNAYKNGLQPQLECKDVWFRYVWRHELSALLNFSFVNISLEGHQQLLCVPMHGIVYCSELGLVRELLVIIKVAFDNYLVFHFLIFENCI